MYLTKSWNYRNYKSFSLIQSHWRESCIKLFFQIDIFLNKETTSEVLCYLYRTTSAKVPLERSCFESSCSHPRIEGNIDDDKISNCLPSWHWKLFYNLYFLENPLQGSSCSGGHNNVPLQVVLDIIGHRDRDHIVITSAAHICWSGTLLVKQRNVC